MTIIYTDGSKKHVAYVIEGVVQAVAPVAGMVDWLGHPPPPTNNEAEYLAIIYALAEVHWWGMKDIEIRSDSELVVSQLTGAYRIKEPRLQRLANMVAEYCPQVGHVCFVWVSRKNNPAGWLLG